MTHPPSKKPGCDILLLVATDDEQAELSAAADELGIPFEPLTTPSGNDYFDLGSPGVSRVYAIRTTVGPFGFGGSASRAIHCQTETGATGIVCLGMAFGIDPHTQDHGDVLVSRALIPYDNKNISSDGGLPKYSYGRVVEFPAKEALVALFRREVERNKERSHRVHFGALLTGSAHIACRAYRDHLAIRCKRNEPVVGGEMEGGGLLSMADKKLPLWVIVKGIVDFADENRDDAVKKYRRPACRNAARFVLEALRNESCNLR